MKARIHQGLELPMVQNFLEMLMWMIHMDEFKFLEFRVIVVNQFLSPVTI